MMSPGRCQTRGAAYASARAAADARSEEHTSELQSQSNLVCRLLLEKKKTIVQSQRLDTALASYFRRSVRHPYYRRAVKDQRVPNLAVIAEEHRHRLYLHLYVALSGR